MLYTHSDSARFQINYRSTPLPFSRTFLLVCSCSAVSLKLDELSVTSSVCDSVEPASTQFYRGFKGYGGERKLHLGTVGKVKFVSLEGFWGLIFFLRFLVSLYCSFELQSSRSDPYGISIPYCDPETHLCFDEKFIRFCSILPST